MLLLAAVTLVTIDARSNGGGVLNNIRGKVDDVFSPLQRATHATLRPVGNFLTGALDYGSLRAENQRLRDQIESMQNQALQSAEDESSAEAIMKLDHLPFVAGIPTVTVQVVDDSSSNFENDVVIDKGSSSGIVVGQPVVGFGGLIGSIVAPVSSSTATIQLISDPSFVVGVKMAGNNTGSAQGAGRDEALRVTVISTSTAAGAIPPPKVTEGETLYTSGLDTEKFPENIPVGKVVSVKTSPDGGEPTATLSPLMDLDALDYLQVLLWSPTPLAAAP